MSTIYRLYLHLCGSTYLGCEWIVKIKTATPRKMWRYDAHFPYLGLR